MIESFAVILQLFIFLFFFSSPFNNQNIKFFFSHNLSIFDLYCLNIFFHLNILLVISFLNFNLKYYFYIILILNIIYCIYYSKIFYFKISKKNIFPFLIFIILNLSLFFELSANPRLEWDALSHWIFKARNFYEGQHIQNLTNLQFPEYPHLGTFIWGFFWKNSFLEYEYFGRFIYIFIYLSALCSVCYYFFKKNFILFSLVLIFLLLISYDKFLFSGYQEYLLFSCLLVISRLFLIFRKNFNGIIFLILIGHLLIWFKDEGLFYFLIFLGPIVFISKISTMEKISSYLGIFLLCLIQYVLQKYLIGDFSFQANIIHDELKNLLNFSFLINKIFLISKFIVISSIKYKLAILNVISIIFALAFLKDLKNLVYLYVFILLINMFVLYAIYLHTPHNIDLLLKVTLDRLIFQTSGFYIIITLYVIKKLFLKFRY